MNEEKYLYTMHCIIFYVTNNRGGFKKTPLPLSKISGGGSSPLAPFPSQITPKGIKALKLFITI